MPKATLEFHLPEETEEFDHVVNAVKYYSALVGLDEFLRSKIKYSEGLTQEALEIYQSIKQELRDLIGDHLP